MGRHMRVVRRAVHRRRTATPGDEAHVAQMRGVSPATADDE
jgi:hypothetical protein